MVLCAWIGAMAQTEKTRGFDDLYHFIENLDVFEYGQEESRAYYIPGHHVLLNGNWKFCYADTPQEIPATSTEGLVVKLSPRLQHAARNNSTLPMKSVLPRPFVLA